MEESRGWRKKLKFRLLDFLAPEPKLKVGGKKAIQTRFGACLSLMVVVSLMGALYFIIKDFLRTDQPKV